MPDVDQVVDRDDGRPAPGERQRVVRSVEQVQRRPPRRPRQHPVLGQCVLARAHDDLAEPARSGREALPLGEALLLGEAPRAREVLRLSWAPHVRELPRVGGRDEGHVALIPRRIEQRCDEVPDVGTDPTVAELARVQADVHRRPAPSTRRGSARAAIASR